MIRKATPQMHESPQSDSTYNPALLLEGLRGFIYRDNTQLKRDLLNKFLRCKPLMAAGLSLAGAHKSVSLCSVSAYYLLNFFLLTVIQKTDFLTMLVHPGERVAFAEMITHKHRVSQARATFLLQLDDRWEMHREARKEMYGLYEPKKMEVFQKHVKLEDKHRMEKLRAACKELVVEVHKTAPPTYDRFLEYLSFFETVGLVVRNGYVHSLRYMRVVSRLLYDAQTSP